MLGVTKDNNNLTIHDGEYGFIKIYSIGKDAKFGRERYYVDFSLENKTDSPMCAGLTDADIDDTNVSFVHDLKTIQSGKKGRMESSIDFDDIPLELKELKEIEATFFIGTNSVQSYYTQPIIIKRDAFKMKLK